MEQVALSKPTVRYKTFRYRTNVEWVGNRAGILRSHGKAEFRVASPPEFRGEAGVWTPEDLFVAAINLCTMTTFAAFADRLNLPVVSYISDAEGILEVVNGKYQFTRVVLHPVVLLGKSDALEQTRKTLHDAHTNCLIANSVRSEVVLEPVIEVVGN